MTVLIVEVRCLVLTGYFEIGGNCFPLFYFKLFILFLLFLTSSLLILKDPITHKSKGRVLDSAVKYTG